MWDIWIPCVISESASSRAPGSVFRWIQPAYDHVFAVPLGVGMESLGDYFDLEMAEDMPTAEIAARLEEQMAEGCISLASAR